MGQSRNGKPGGSCSMCGHAAGLHSNEACEAIRCECRVTRKQLASGAVPVTPPAVVTTVVPVFVPAAPSRERAPVAEAIKPEAPAAQTVPVAEPKKKRTSRGGRPGGTHAA